MSHLTTFMSLYADKYIQQIHMHIFSACRYIYNISSTHMYVYMCRHLCFLISYPFAFHYTVLTAKYASPLVLVLSAPEMSSTSFLYISIETVNTCPVHDSLVLLLTKNKCLLLFTSVSSSLMLRHTLGNRVIFI